MKFLLLLLCSQSMQLKALQWIFDCCLMVVFITKILNQISNAMFFLLLQIQFSFFICALHNPKFQSKLIDAWFTNVKCAYGNWESGYLIAMCTMYSVSFIALDIQFCNMVKSMRHGVCSVSFDRNSMCFFLCQFRKEERKKHLSISSCMHFFCLWYNMQRICFTQ